MSSSAGNKCSVCSRTFKRLEHLTRHARSHTKEKPFNCVACGKNYSRLDILNRHHSRCHESSLQASPTVSSRACRQCAIGRVRCSKQYPCSRCAEKSLQCSYPRSAKVRSLRPSDIVAEEARPQQLNANDAPEHAESASITVDISLVPEDMADARGSQPLFVGMEPVPNVVQELGNNNPWLAIGNGEPMDRLSLQDDVLIDQQNINRFYDVETGQHFDQHPLADLSTNWLSPPYEAVLDWNDQLRMGSSCDNLRDFTFPFSTRALEIASEPGVMWETTDGYTVGQPHQSSVARTSQARPNLLTAQPSEDFNTEQDEMTSAQTMITSNASTLGDGEYYVEGTGARAPFGGRHLRAQSDICDHVTGQAASEEPATIDRDSCLAHTNISNSSPDILVSKGAYNDMLRKIREGEQLHSPEEDIEPPSMAYINALVQLYFARFHPVFPFLRKDSFRSETDTNGILLLAVSAVGSRYTHALQAAELRKRLLDVLGKLLRQAHDSMAESEEDTWLPTARTGDRRLALSLLQARILNFVCLTHGSKGSLTRHALSERYALVEACHAMDLLRPGNVNLNSNEPDSDATQTEDWLERQCETRTGMMIWLLDSAACYEFGCKSLMCLTDAQAPLPCPEHVLKSVITGEGITKVFESVALTEAIEMLYIEKRLPPDLSEFSTLLLVHAIYRKTKEVVSHSKTHLSSWVPSRKTQPRPQSALPDESWPPATPILSSWRNSACDCLDILHWRANSKIAQAAGWEHPTVLYLHLARLVLLTPTDHLQCLATSSGDTGNIDGDRYTKARDHVLQWAIRDQFKARLSLVHAGALLWHARRFSISAFVEPFAIYMATLVVWAYSVSVQFATQQGLLGASQSSPNATGPSFAEPQLTSPTTLHEEPDPDPAVIYLDRPCDDEMVQSYVRQGHKMTGSMLRVSNICAPDAPKKILREGLRLLEGKAEERTRLESTPGGTQQKKPDIWGIESTYAKSLKSLL